MPAFLENLIIFALILNVVAFALYGLSLKSKRIKKEKVPADGISEALSTKEEFSKETVEAELNTEVKSTFNENELDRLVEELKEINNIPDEEEIVEEKKEEKEEEKPYETEFVEEIKTEVKEVDKITEPFDLIEGMDEKSKFEEENKEKDEQVFSIDKNEANEKTENIVKGERLEAKREIMDSVNILEVEGDEDPEDINDEIVVRYYEPLVYQNGEEVEEKEEVDEDDEDKIEKRIAYLTGEWTEEYVIQPKKKDEENK